MHRADDAMQAVPTQAGSPMNVGLEQAAGNRSAYRKDQGEEKRSGDELYAEASHPSPSVATRPWIPDAITT